MAKCIRCGCEYDKEDVVLLHADVSRVPVDMCQDCLDETYDMGETGLFYDTCERCGKSYDVFEEKDTYDNQWIGAGKRAFDDFDEVLCSDCAIQEMERLNSEDKDELGFNDDDDD